jgi:hypothetical protein
MWRSRSAVSSISVRSLGHGKRRGSGSTMNVNSARGHPRQCLDLDTAATVLDAFRADIDRGRRVAIARRAS